MPESAQVWLDGDAVTGDLVPLPIDGQVHQLRLSAPGYHGQVRALDGATPDLLEIKLQPLSKPPHHGKASGPRPIDP
jgi:hypothetical protein